MGSTTSTDTASITSPTSSQTTSTADVDDVVGKRLVSSAWDNTMRVWRVGDDWLCDHEILVGHNDAAICLLEVGDEVYSGGDDSLIKVWDKVNWTYTRVLSGHSNAVWAMVECVGRVVSASFDSSIRVW